MSGGRSRTNTAEERVRRTTPEDNVPPSPARAQLQESLSVVDTVTQLAATLQDLQKQQLEDREEARVVGERTLFMGCEGLTRVWTSLIRWG